MATSIEAGSGGAVQRRRRLPALRVQPTTTAATCPPDGKHARPSTEENLPAAYFTGSLHYAYTTSEIDRCCQWLLHTSGVTVFGFDIEWWVRYQTGETPRPVALIQLCYDQQQPAGSQERDTTASNTGRPTISHVCHEERQPPPHALQQHQQPRQQQRWPQHCCLLLHICHSGLTPHLQQLLCSKDILKVGVGILGDAQKLYRDFGLQMQGVVCLSDYANARVSTANSAASLHGPPSTGDHPPTASTGNHPRPAASAVAMAAGSAAPAACAISSSGAGQLQLAGLPTGPHKWSLAGLVSLLLGLRLDKGQALRCSNWEVRPPLSSEQQLYAAGDAQYSLLVYEMLSKLPVTESHPAVPAAGSAGNPLGLSSLSIQLGAAAAADWVPSCAALRPLQPAKLAAYHALMQGACVEEVAAQRRLQPDTVLGYMSEAVSAGLGYSLSCLGVSTELLRQVSSVCGTVLDRELLWQPAAARHKPAQGEGSSQQQQQQQHQHQQPPGQLTGQKRARTPGPHTPLACAATHQGGSTGAGTSSAMPAQQVAPTDSAPGPPAEAAAAAEAGEWLNVGEALRAAGYTLRDLKEAHFAEISYGQLRLVLAHLGRCNPLQLPGC
ncbi:Werner Syndrome-like exonuclease [Chlorella vulgaris]